MTLVEAGIAAPRSARPVEVVPERAWIVLFGGAFATALLDDTWQWDGAMWINRQPGRFREVRDAALIHLYPAACRTSRLRQ